MLSPRAGVVLACTVGNAVSITPMVFTVFGLFLLPISAEFNWPRSAISLVLLIISITGALSNPIVGLLVDRFGARVVTLIGNLVFAASIAGVSLIGPHRLELYAAYALIGITGTLPSSITFTKIIAGWFDRNRGLFLGVTGGLGNGVGAALSPLLVEALITHHGWRVGYQGVGVVTAAIGFPILFAWLRDPIPAAGAEAAGTDSGQADDMTLSQARKTGKFWIILIAVALGAGCMTAVFAHVVPMLLDRGLSPDRATYVLVVFSMVTAGWQIAVGFLLDRVPRAWIATPFYLIALAGLILFATTSNYPRLLLAGALMGLGLGTEYGVLPYFLSRYFGVRHYGSISGAVFGFIVLTQGITPFLMDLVFDATGSYYAAIVTIGAGLLGGALLILRLPPFRMSSRS